MYPILEYTHRTSKPYYFIFQLKIFMKILVDIVKHLNFVFLIDFGEVLGSFCNLLPLSLRPHSCDVFDFGIHSQGNKLNFLA